MGCGEPILQLVVVTLDIQLDAATDVAAGFTRRPEQ